MKEKRNAKRIDILDSFCIFAVLPKKGMYRLMIHDVSLLGIGFNIDMEEDAPEFFQPKEGEVLDIHLYLNQSLFLPLTVKLVRLTESKGVRKVGAEFQNLTEPAKTALHAFINMIDSVEGFAQLEASQ